MAVQRINRCPVKLDKLTDDELFRLGEYIGRNLDQAERELRSVQAEIVRREWAAHLPPAS